MSDLPERIWLFDHPEFGLGQEWSAKPAPLENGGIAYAYDSPERAMEANQRASIANDECKRLRNKDKALRARVAELEASRENTRRVLWTLAHCSYYRDFPDEVRDAIMSGLEFSSSRTSSPAAQGEKEAGK